MEKEYQIFNSAGEHDYTIKTMIDPKKGVVYQLCRSMSSHWTSGVRGTVCLTLMDSGNDYVISKEMNSKKPIGYDVMTELYILLRFINTTEKYSLYGTGGKIQVAEVIQHDI